MRGIQLVRDLGEDPKSARKSGSRTIGVKREHGRWNALREDPRRTEPRLNEPDLDEPDEHELHGDELHAFHRDEHPCGGHLSVSDDRRVYPHADRFQEDCPEGSCFHGCDFGGCYRHDQWGCDELKRLLRCPAWTFLCDCGSWAGLFETESGSHVRRRDSRRRLLLRRGRPAGRRPGQNLC